MSYKFSLILFLTLGVVSCSNELVDLSIPESFTSRVPPDSLSYYNLNYDYVLTEEQKQIYYPEIEENEVVHDLNWGYDDNDTVLAYNDGHYSIVCNWNVGGATFNTAPVIYCNFQ